MEEWTAEQLAACTAANSEGKSAGWCFPGSGFCVEDERFMVWMRTAGLPTFRKTYAIINTPITVRRPPARPPRGRPPARPRAFAPAAARLLAPPTRRPPSSPAPASPLQAGTEISA